jgi:hypothetical protein
MTLEEKRSLALAIYEAHGLRVVEWVGEDTKATVVSLTPRSYFDLIDEVEMANREIRVALKGV